ncbi:MAG: F0F1 ATP synthase subunit B [Verrucomicrobia bacterium]|nr:F0F1 ATP synthase subunit B [Verrucomicrobiota bacterium]
MNSTILMANIAGDLVEIAQGTAEKFGVDGPHLIAQIVSFSIVAYVLHRFAYRPILKVLEERRDRIAESLENAEKIKAELAETEEKRAEVIKKANRRADELIAHAKASAERVQEIETQRAIAAAEQIVAKAPEATELEHERMLTDLKKEIGGLVVKTTARVTGKILDDEDQGRLLEEANKELAA